MKPSEDCASARPTAGSRSRLPKKATPTRLATPSAIVPRRCPSDALLNAHCRSSAASRSGGGGFFCGKHSARSAAGVRDGNPWVFSQAVLTFAGPCALCY